MKAINPEDPKWTAYVLGELDDAERAAIELELEASEEARILVEELRFAAQLTKTELREAVSVVPLSDEQRETIRASAESMVPQPRRWFQMPRLVWAGGLAAASAAVLLLAIRIAPLQEPSFESIPAASAPAVTGPSQQNTTPPADNDSSKPIPGFGLRYEHPGVPPEALRTDVPNLKAAVQLSEERSPASVKDLRQEQKKEVALPGAGRIIGTVTDASGALVPGVKVTATNTQAGSSAAMTTDPSGAYSLEGLRAGTYKITGELPGFVTTVRDGLEVAANADAKQDLRLQIGAVAQAVEVTTGDRAASPASAPPPPAGRQQGAGVGEGAGVLGRVGRAQQQGQQGQVQQQNRVQIGNSFAEVAPRSIVAPGVPPGYDRILRPRPNGNEAYDSITDNPFLPVAQNPLSTFSIDVDTASYSNVRRMLNQGQLPPPNAVRIEELINYFSYDYAQPIGSSPVGAVLETAAAPWNPQHRLVRIGIKARDIQANRRPQSNLVFLLDVSGSMQPAERLPLLKDGLRMLVEQLTANDRVTIVTYAGTTGVALQPTRGDQKDTILSLINSLQAGGSTNGGSGIQLAYEQAAANFIAGGANRVILATDGDFNVGITDRNALLRLIEEKAKTGVFLSVLGVGMGNYKDATLEMLADKGNGHFAYIDTLNEARKVLVDEMSGTLVTVAKDVKVQVEFNPAVVDAYRLIGYENRALRNEDFNNDLKDAGDMGAGHAVTVLYEVVPRGVAIGGPGVDPLKYQQPVAPPPANASNETMNVKIRYKEPTATDSKLLVFPLVDREQTLAQSSVDFRFAAAVASFGMILRDSPYKGTSSFDSVIGLAEDSLGSDRYGYRREFLQLVQRARQLRR